MPREAPTLAPRLSPPRGEGSLPLSPVTLSTLAMIRSPEARTWTPKRAPTRAISHGLFEVAQVCIRCTATLREQRATELPDKEGRVR